MDEQLLDGLLASSQKSQLKQCAIMAACLGQQRLALAGQKLASPVVSTFSVNDDPGFLVKLMIQISSIAQVCQMPC